MVTQEQRKQISLYLLSKNLPMDLVIEIHDHMVEQMENMEYADFDSAFKEVKEAWKEELTLQWNILSFTYRTKLHQKAINNAFKPKIWLSFKVLFCYVLIYSILFGVSESIAYWYIYLIHLSLCIGVLMLFVFNYKLLNTTTYQYRKKISYQQRGGALLLMSLVQLAIVLFLGFDMHFNNLKTFVGAIIKMDFSTIPYFSLFSLHAWFILTVIGYLYFVDYKKTVAVLQKRIPLKL